MSRSRSEGRFLRWLSRVTVVVWAVALLAVSVLEAEPVAAPELEQTRVAVIEEAPSPEPEDEVTPVAETEPRAPSEVPSEPPAPEPTPLAGDAAGGEAWLAGERPFPVLSAGYEAFRSFDRYARAMQSLGARFVVVRGREIVGQADLDTGELDLPGSLAGFSPRARNYAGELRVARVERAARERFGDGSAIRMLVPRTLDAALFGGIARALQARGESPEQYSELKGRYEPGANGNAWIRVDSGTRADGVEVSLDLLFDLGELAGRSSA